MRHLPHLSCVFSVFLVGAVPDGFAQERASQAIVPAKPVQQPPSKTVRRFVICRDDDVHECFPSLCKTTSGRLILAYRESDEHQPRKYTRLIVRLSDDNGASWSRRHVLKSTQSDVPDRLYKLNCPKVQQLQDGRLLYLCDAFVNDLSKRRRDRYVDARILFWFSNDNGTSWSEAIETDVGGVMPDEVVELDARTWLLATHLPDPKDGHLVQYVTRSTNGGKTWGQRSVIADRKGYNLCEASIIKLPDGLLICYMRENSGLGRPIYKSLSSDGGRTWDGPHATQMDGGHRPVAHLTADGRILVTYRYYPGRGAGMRNTLMYLESRGSARQRERSKQRGRIRPLDYDAHAHPDSGYTGWVELAPGEFYAVNYIRDDAPMAQIRGYRFAISAF